MAHKSTEEEYADQAFRSASPEMEQTAEEATNSLAAAVLYIGPDRGEKPVRDKQCQSCMMWVREKKKCTIHGPSVEVPTLASCGYWIAGKNAPSDHELHALLTPRQSGLIYGKVRCENCVRANEETTVCVALTDVLQKVCGFEEAEFKIEKMGCCNWNRVRGQKKPGERKSEDFA